MKNIFRFLMAAVIFFGAVSCAKEDISSSLAGGEVEVTFTANLPELGTRAYGDGANANLLRYWVYDAANGNLLEDLSDQEPGSGTFTFTLPLIKGMTYDFVLWADKDGLYNVNDEGIVTVDYANANNNDRDAFYGFVKGFDPLKSTPKFTLIRPFAQLNAATSENMEDIEANGLTLESSSIKAKAYTQFNIKACTVVDSSLTEVTLAAEVMPYMAQDENGNPAPNKLPGKETYTYLAMGYILAPQDGMVSDVTFCFNGKKGGADFTVGGDKGLSYGNVPLKQNYRTNILGQLLTKSTEIEVEINPAFGIPDIEDYEEVAPGLCLINGNTYLITSLEGLKSFATLADGVTRSTIDFKGKTVELAVDIDLENNPWTPINEFNGTFDGQGHTIKNVKIVAENKAYAGFFANAQGTIKNLTLENVDIKGHYKAGAIVGNGLCSRIENCHVLNGTIETSPLNKDDGNHAGGITGYLSAENNAWVKDCSVKNVTVIAYRDCGALIGTVNGSKNIVKLEVCGNTVENVTVIANMLPEYVEADKEPNAGEFVGRNIKSVDLTDNTATNVVVEVLKFDNNNTLELKTAVGLDIIATNIAEQRGYADKTIKLANDIDLNGIDFDPIGYNNSYSNDNKIYFEGTFDGNNKTIKNLKRYDSTKDNKRAIGLFSQVKNAVVKDLTMEDFVAATYGGEAAAIACEAVGDCTFENLTFKKGSVVSYNNDTAPVIGWANKGNFTLKNITVHSDVTIHSLWDSYDTTLGGLIGTLESPSTVTIENATISCTLNAFNDVTGNYQWYNYRRTGMVIGNMSETQTINGRTFPNPAAAGVTCTNITVNYGDWMNYHYCEFESNGKPSYADPGEWKFSRVEGQEWGREENIDTDNCQHDVDESHNICLPVDQLFGGDQGVSGLREYTGVTVNYPASYRREVSSAAALTEALGKGLSVVLDADIDLGSNILTLDKGQTLDLGGKTLTQSGSNRGVILKNGASLKNGVINHSGIVAAVRAWNVESIENVTINVTPTDGKVKGGIVIQEGADNQIALIKNVTITGATNGIETYNCGWTDNTPAIGAMENVNIDATDTGILLSAHIGKATNCNIKGANHGINMHLKGEYRVGIELENCTVEGTTASIWGHDEKGISNTNNCSLTLTYDAATKLVGRFVWDFEEECQSVVTLNRPQ